MDYTVLYARELAKGANRSAEKDDAVMRGLKSMDNVTVRIARNRTELLAALGDGKIDLLIADMPKKGKDFARDAIVETKVKYHCTPAIVVSDIAERNVGEALKGLTWETVKKDRDPKPIMDIIKKHMARKMEIGGLPAERGRIRTPADANNANPSGGRGSGLMKPIKQ